jgi:hypothetical protein
MTAFGISFIVAIVAFVAFAGGFTIADRRSSNERSLELQFQGVYDADEDIRREIHEADVRFEAALAHHDAAVSRGVENIYRSLADLDRRVETIEYLDTVLNPNEVQ